MARGWESKNVEDQINERQAASSAKATTQLTREELEQRSKREGLLLARAHTLKALESARDKRYRAMLERALDHLDKRLAEL